MKKTILALAALVSSLGLNAQTLAFPTAEGYGKYASGGRGGEVVEVTNLTDDPTNPAEGSFRWALKQYSGKPITIVFRVSGTIDLKGNDLRSKRNNITIAGQTAPGDGICLKGGCLNLGGSRNIIMRHFRSRVGVLNDTIYAPGKTDGTTFIPGAALNIENGGNFIIDHCSFGWSAEENVGWYDNDHTTVQWCLFTEGLFRAGHAKGDRSYGAVLGGKTATYHHNLLAHNYNRSPRFGATTKNDKVMLLDFVNNVNYNWGKAASCYGGDNRQGDQGLFQLNFVNNYYKPGPARDGSQKNNFIGASYCNPSQGSQGTSYGKWHLEGNYMDGTWAEENGVNADNYKAFDISAYQENVAGLTLDDLKSDHIDVGEYAVNTESAQDAYNSVLANAGAFPRDAGDARIINEVKTGTAEYYGCCNAGRAKGIIDKPSDVGGYPELKTYNEITDADHDGMDDAWETANGFDPTNPDDRNTVLKGGYTALEAYLCSLVGETIEIAKPESPFDIVVAKDGSGDYTTINEAIEAAPEGTKRTVIFVKNGTYEEKVFVGTRYTESSKIISLIGESKDSVIVTWDDYHGKSISYPGKGTVKADGMTAATMTVTSPDFYMENITVRNTVKDDVAQAEALYQSGDRQVLKNVSIEGYQDSHRQKKTKRYFYYDCTVKGNVDFIYGGGTAYYYKCNIVNRPLTRSSKAGGYITAPEDIASKTTLQSGAPLYYEYFFNDCKLTAEDGASGAYLSRPWADSDCGTIYLNCLMGDHISAAGFGGNGNATSMCFGEYNSMDLNGAALDLSSRVSWAQKLTDKDAVTCGLDNIYNAVKPSSVFDPVPSVVGVAPVTNLQIFNNFLTWTASEGTRGYIVYNNGKIIAFTDGCSYNDTAKLGGTYTVRAIAENGALSPLNGESYTLNADEMRRVLNPVDESGDDKQQYTVSVTASPAEGGTVAASAETVAEGESVTLTAKANDGYTFKNWTLASGRVLGTEAELTLTVTENIEAIATFTANQKELAYHTPANTEGLDFELTYLLNIIDENSNATTGKTEYTIANEYTDWIRCSQSPLQTTNRNYAEIDARTGEKVDIYDFNAEPYASMLKQTTILPVVGQNVNLYFYVQDTKKAKFFFNGSSSTAGTAKLTITPVGEASTTMNSTIELSKKTTIKSDTLAVELNPSKQYELKLNSTSDFSVWAVSLWQGTSTGIDGIAGEAMADGDVLYNLSGQRVMGDYKGIVISKNRRTKFMKH